MFASRRQASRTMLGCVVAWFVCGVLATLAPDVVAPLMGLFAVVLGVLFLVALVNWVLYLNRDINRR